ncbi:MAG: leucine-rich repeat domain-containing protein [bacterium]|nr:leucine-rich repeat domain-containing protein [bacterium]
MLSKLFQKIKALGKKRLVIHAIIVVVIIALVITGIVFLLQKDQPVKSGSEGSSITNPEISPSNRYEPYAEESSSTPEYDVKTSGDYDYADVEGGAIILKYNGNKKDVTLPSQIENKPVVEIGNDIFDSDTRLENIVIPSTVKKINDYAFQYAGIRTITIPDSVISIGKGAFKGCAYLNGVKIPNSVQILGAGVFSECSSLSDVTLSNSLTEISNDLFYECVALDSISIPSNVTRIGNYAFSACSLKTVSIPDVVTEIGDHAFAFCEQLESVQFSESLVKVSEFAFHFCKSLKSVKLPDSAKTIEQYAFYGCTSLSELDIASDAQVGKFALNETKYESQYK